MRRIAFTIAFGVALAIGAPALAQTYGIGTNPQGSLFYASGAAISKLMVETTGLQFRVAPYAGSSTYLPLIDNGQLAFGKANAAEAAFAYSGTAVFEGRAHKNIRQVAATLPTNSAFAVRTDSPIKTVADLKGKKVPVGYNSGRIFHYLAGAALATAGLTDQDLDGVPTPNFIEGIKSFMAGRVDAAYIPFNVAIGKQAMATIPGGWRYLTMEDTPTAEKAIQGMLPPARIAREKPGPNATGVVVDPTQFVQVDFTLVAGAQVPEDVVYKVTKAIYENKPALVKSLGAFNRFLPEKMARKHPNPYHPGAIRFYQEVDLWPPK